MFLGTITEPLVTPHRLSGAYPFGHPSDANLLKVKANINAGRYNFADAAWKKISESGLHSCKYHPMLLSLPAKDLIRKLLVVDSVQRLDIDGIIAHEWTVSTLFPCKVRLLM